MLYDGILISISIYDKVFSLQKNWIDIRLENIYFINHCFDFSNSRICFLCFRLKWIWIKKNYTILLNSCYYIFMFNWSKIVQ